MISLAEFNANLAHTKETIASACAQSGRNVQEVKLLAVTKTWPVEAVHYAIQAGLWGVGESRVQEAVDKGASLGGDARWELIGHLQSNKAKAAATHFTRIQSVDSLSLLAKLNAIAERERSGRLPILVQVNAGNDPAKFGVDLEDIYGFFEQAMGAAHIRIEGLMTIAPLSEDLAVAERSFERLRLVRDELVFQFKITLPELSMGMSGDYPEAIRQGSTLIRLGSALFGDR